MDICARSRLPGTWAASEACVRRALLLAGGVCTACRLDAVWASSRRERAKQLINSELYTSED
eukprot:664335-Pleurochrysis_carterae.AAC.2